MRVLIGVPPLDDPRGNFQTMSNRQVQVFKHGAFIYPPVVASAATMLKEAGHEVIWADGEAEGMLWEEYVEDIKMFQPDLIAWEVKTPSVKGTWKRVDSIKELIPNVGVVLFGDHITALPDETLNSSRTDSVITGGDYDFALCEFVKQGCPKGRLDFPTTSKLDALPIPNRKLTRYELYAYGRGSGNYKYTPGTHTYFGRDCWWRKDGGCTFCSWTNTFKNFRVVSVGRAVDEIKACDYLGIREVFDDTGTFPIGGWLHEFCEQIIKWREKSHSKISIGCNMRPGALKESDYKLMGQAGFRFILYGMESANYKTTELINKGQSDGDTEESTRWASRYGMDPHLTLMVGYPWESSEDAQRTIEKARELFRKGYAKTLQATICIPYPGTKLYTQCIDNGWLKYSPGDWDKWDMRRPVMTCPMSDEEVLSMTRGIYKGCITPQYMARTIANIRSVDDFKYLFKGFRYLRGHLADFSSKGK